MNKKEGARKISWIKEKANHSKYHVSEHVIRAITERRIAIREIASAISNGAIIEYHLNPERPDSSLVMGVSGKKPIHVLCSEGHDGHLMVLLAYVPSPPLWRTPGIRKKKGANDMCQPVKTCFFCGSPVKEITIGNFDYRLEGKLYVLKDVPAGLCLQCGEKYVTAQVAEKINELVDAEAYSATVEVPVLEFR